MQIVKTTSDTCGLGRGVRRGASSGTKIGKGSTVTLHVSTGKPQVTVPDVVGQSVTDAVASLVGQGLQANIVRLFSDKQPDTVTAQQPHAGDRVVKGSGSRSTSRVARSRCRCRM